MAEPEVAIVVPETATGMRLDRFLAERLQQPRSQVQQWIRAGLVRVDGQTVKPAHAVSDGEHLLVRQPAPTADDRIEPEPGDLELLYEDDQVVVVDKPAGLAMHPGAGRPTGTLVHRLLAAYPEMATVGGSGRPGIVHRLDIDTTGAVVVARTATAYQKLSRAFSERAVEKTYLALCYGTPRPGEGSWTEPIGRHPTRRTEMAVRGDGRSAQTDYAVVASEAGVSMLRLLLGTGRTHQIRVHLKAAGHPLVGDPVYGEARWKGLERRVQRPLAEFPRPALHAWRLTFEHPATDDEVSIVAPPPADLHELWAALGPAPTLPI